MLSLQILRLQAQARAVRERNDLNELRSFVMTVLPRAVNKTKSHMDHFYINMITQERIGTWNILTKRGLARIVDEIRQLDGDMVSIASGSCFQERQMMEHFRAHGVGKEVIATDLCAGDDMVSIGTPYMPRHVLDAADAPDAYPLCTMFYASRLRKEFAVPFLQALLRVHPTGPLLIVLAGTDYVGEFGDEDGYDFSETREFHQILAANGFTTEVVEGGLEDLPRGADDRDQLLIIKRA